MTQIPLDEIKSLSADYPPIDIHEHNRAIGNFNNMNAFYEQRGKSRDDVMGKIFRQYGITIMYAIRIITLYRQLTNRLSKLAGEAKDDTGRKERR